MLIEIISDRIIPVVYCVPVVALQDAFTAKLRERLALSRCVFDWWAQWFSMVFRVELDLLCRNSHRNSRGWFSNHYHKGIFSTVKGIKVSSEQHCELLDTIFIFSLSGPEPTVLRHNGKDWYCFVVSHPGDKQTRQQLLQLLLQLFSR